MRPLSPQENSQVGKAFLELLHKGSSGDSSSPDGGERSEVGTLDPADVHSVAD